MGAYIKIKENYNSFTKSEKKIGEYILGNLEKGIKLSAQELGELTGTSPASIIRFSKKLGYTSLTDFKIDLSNDKSIQNRSKQDYIIDRDDSIEVLLEKLFFRNKVAMKDTLELHNESNFIEIVERIKRADNIYIFAIGASGLVAMDFQYKMMRINKRAHYNLDNNIQLVASMNTLTNDVAIGISYSGETKEVNLAIEQAKKNGTFTIGIVKSGKNRLSELVDIKINIPQIEKQIRIGAISSRISQLFITDALFLGVIKSDLDYIDRKLIKSRELIGRLKE